ncbi:hypothetical protein APY94_02975 [Thermococcus celericrescens]|uniref:Uncharacterized protein n=1 Tax=Thermococcus celericrescens TaxID=227598 RepID=A0A100XZ61_9EURY|nr:hypothetical protein [Thermococcus celericrescens]KUH34253.1 hypothetical protein APY94_02975 [Thermococcus celericrescens]
MGFTASYVLPGGRVGVKYFSSREEMEAWKRAHPGGKLLNIREKKPRNVRDIPPRPPSPDEVLRRKYGIGLKEIQDIVNSSKSQPEAIAKLRKRLTGSTKYDPRYHELEVVLTQAWDAREHPYIPDAKKKYEDTLRSMVVRNTKGFYSDGKRILPKPEPKPIPTPKPRPVLEKLERNTGVKSVPEPEPKPTIVATRVPTNAEPHTVHTTAVQQGRGIDLRKVGLGLLGLAVLYYFMRRG